MTSEDEIVAKQAITIFDEKRDFEEHLSEMADYNVELERKIFTLFFKELDILKKYKNHSLPPELEHMQNQILDKKANPQTLGEVMMARESIHKFYEKFSTWNNRRKTRKED